LSRQQRPQVSHLNPRKCPQIAGYLAETRNGRLASNCVVVDAAPIEPVSSVKFPDNWENTGNFTYFDPAIRFRGLIREQLQSLTEKFPAQRNWEFLWRNRETKRWNREVEKLRSCAESFHWYQARSIKRPSSSPPRKCLWLQAFLSPRPSFTFCAILQIGQ